MNGHVDISVSLSVFFFHVDQEVFRCVISWVILLSIVNGFITLLPLIWHDCPYYTALSIVTRVLYTSIPYETFHLLSFITSGNNDSDRAWKRFCDLRDRYRGRMSSAVKKAGEEMTSSEQLSEIDVRILDWTIRALSDDDSQERFFEPIPDSFNSNLVNLQGVFHESFSKISGLRWMGSWAAHCHPNWSVDHTNLYSFFDPLVSIEQLQAMARWFTHHQIMFLTFHESEPPRTLP